MDTLIRLNHEIVVEIRAAEDILDQNLGLFSWILDDSDESQIPEKLFPQLAEIPVFGKLEHPDDIADQEVVRILHKGLEHEGPSLVLVLGLYTMLVLPLELVRAVLVAPADEAWTEDVADWAARMVVHQERDRCTGRQADTTVSSVPVSRSPAPPQPLHAMDTPPQSRS